MKKLVCFILICFIGLISAQGVVVGLGTADATSSFDVQDMNALPLARVQGNGWTGFLNAIPPDYPHHLSTSYYDDSGPLYYQPAALFENTRSDRDAVGVAGFSYLGDWWGVGVYGVGGWQGVRGEVFSGSTNNTQDYNGVYGYAQSADGLTRGVKGYGYMGHRVYGGYFYGGYANDRSYGARGYAEGGPINYGLYGYGAVAASGGISYGVFGHAEGANAKNYGGYFYATGATNNWAVYASGDLYCSGTLSKAAGSFKIDHPLDPENKYLSHSFVESPDMMNIYNGNVELNYSGEAKIELPEWFNALNSDFRYQLTAIGSPGPNLYVAEEVNGNTFRIAGGIPGMKVSWQLTGIRKDAFAIENRIKVEEYKTGDDIGRFLHPEEHGMLKSKQINFDMILQEKEKLAKDNNRQERR
jgi:hypothetical protein